MTKSPLALSAGVAFSHFLPAGSGCLSRPEITGKQKHCLLIITINNSVCVFISQKERVCVRASACVCVLSL